MPRPTVRKPRHQTDVPKLPIQRAGQQIWIIIILKKHGFLSSFRSYFSVNYTPSYNTRVYILLLCRTTRIIIIVFYSVNNRWKLNRLHIIIIIIIIICYVLRIINHHIIMVASFVRLGYSLTDSPITLSLIINYTEYRSRPFLYLRSHDDHRWTGGWLGPWTSSPTDLPVPGCFRQ